MADTVPPLSNPPLKQDTTSPAAPPSPLSSDDYLFVEAGHPSTMLQGLNSLRLNNAFCDITLFCAGHEFPCHRVVLASFSSYFKVMFSTGVIESREERVVIYGVEPLIFGMLVSYAYTSEVLISKANVQALLAAANLLDFMAVRDACCRFMEHQMDEINCVGIHCFAEAHSCKPLEKSSMDYIMKHFSTVYQQEEFLSLSEDKLSQIIGSDYVNVPREEMVCEAAMLWLKKCPTHKQSFEKVLEHIRLPLISPYYLHDVIESLDVVKESQGCQRLISETKDYLLLKDRRGELFCPQAQPRMSTAGTAEMIVTVGEENEEEMLSSVKSFDPVTNHWKNLACLPSTVRYHGLVVSDSKLYLAGGIFPDDSCSREMWRYEPCFDSWLKLAPMNVARFDLGLVMLDGYIFAVGGVNGRFRLDSVERYDPDTNSWQFIESVKMTVAYSAVVTLNGLLYVAGGQLEGGGETDRVQVFQPKTSVWTEVAPMLIPRSALAACTLKGKIYVIGGCHASKPTAEVEFYNPKINQWTMCTPMKKIRWQHGVAVVDGKIYVLGGERDRYRETIERFCNETNTWEIMGKMPTSFSRRSFSCVSLQLRKDESMNSFPGTTNKTNANNPCESMSG